MGLTDDGAVTVFALALAVIGVLFCLALGEAVAGHPGPVWAALGLAG